MSCKMVTFFDSDSGGNVRQVTNETLGISVYMPNYQKFQDIRFHIKTDSGSHEGVRLSEAYQKENFPWLPVIPSGSYNVPGDIRENLIPCIKRIYARSEFDPNHINVDGSKGMFVDKVPGEWIYTDACGCISEAVAYENDRMNIGDGFIVPSTQEITQIKDLMNQNISFVVALVTVCADIMPPLTVIPCIEQGIINNPTWQWYDIYTACRTTYLKNLPSDPDNTPDTPKSNTLLYVALGVGILLLLTRKT